MVETEADLSRLRPVERRIVELARSGVADVDIAQRFRRTPGYVRRVLALADVPRQEMERAIDDLRPIERVVLNWIDKGARPADIASRLRKTPTYVLQVERLARRKLTEFVVEVDQVIIEDEDILGPLPSDDTEPPGAT
jgi:DNA-binding CsgD family transcriptional regulator